MEGMKEKGREEGRNGERRGGSVPSLLFLQFKHYQQRINFSSLHCWLRRLQPELFS